MIVATLLGLMLLGAAASASPVPDGGACHPTSPPSVALLGFTSAAVFVETEGTGRWKTSAITIEDYKRLKSAVVRQVKGLGLRIDEQTKTADEAVVRVDIVTEISTESSPVAVRLSLDRTDGTRFVCRWQVARRSVVGPGEAVVGKVDQMVAGVLKEFADAYRSARR